MCSLKTDRKKEPTDVPAGCRKTGRESLSKKRRRNGKAMLFVSFSLLFFRSMVSSSHRRAERLRSLLSWSEALSADTDDALARCESDLKRAAELVAPTVARTKVRVDRWCFFFRASEQAKKTSKNLLFFRLRPPAGLQSEESNDVA